MMVLTEAFIRGLVPDADRCLGPILLNLLFSLALTIWKSRALLVVSL